MLVEELFEEALQSLRTCILVNKNLRRNHVLSLQLSITFDERFKITSVQFIITDFSLLSCQLDNITFKLLY